MRASSGQRRRGGTAVHTAQQALARCPPIIVIGARNFSLWLPLRLRCQGRAWRAGNLQITVDEHVTVPHCTALRNAASHRELSWLIKSLPQDWLALAGRCTTWEQHAPPVRHPLPARKRKAGTVGIWIVSLGQPFVTATIAPPTRSSPWSARMVRCALAQCAHILNHLVTVHALVVYR